jgi:hypothetical protein
MNCFRVSVTIAVFAFGVTGALVGEARAFNHPIAEKSNDAGKTQIQSVTALMVNPQQQNLIGTVTAIDTANGKIIVKTDAGSSVAFSTNDKTTVRRLPPGQTSIANAEKITLADIKVSDRVLVPGGAADIQTAVRQVIVMASEAIAAKRDQDKSEWQTRGINGRITALNQEKKEITVQARGGAEIITVKAPGNAKILRYAPDSLRSTDARTGVFTDMRVGDQIRILGNRSADGKTVTAEEIVSGTVTRAFGTITDINKAANEIIIKNSQTGQTFTVVLGKNSVVKRLPAEVAQNLSQRRERRQQRRQTQAESTGAQTENQGQRRRERRNGENRERRSADAGDAQRPRGGLQQMLEAQPAITIADLKKGDALMVTGTQGADASRLTAVNIISGDAELMQLMQRSQGGRNGNMSPGLPGNVGGGNVPNDDEP